jgi:hypothetical protein
VLMFALLRCIASRVASHLEGSVICRLVEGRRAGWIEGADCGIGLTG